MVPCRDMIDPKGSPSHTQKSVYTLPIHSTAYIQTLYRRCKRETMITKSLHKNVPLLVLFLALFRTTLYSSSSLDSRRFERPLHRGKRHISFVLGTHILHSVQYLFRRCENYNHVNTHDVFSDGMDTRLHVSMQ